MKIPQRGFSGRGVPAIVVEKTETRVIGYREPHVAGGQLQHFNVKHNGKMFKLGAGTGTARFYFQDA